jgi:tRNA (guanine-N7-)-methyltransferase
MTGKGAPGTRGIRSYVLRQGRTTPSQQRALDLLSPKYGLPYTPSLAETKTIFGRSAPVVVEIGSGMGETTALIAQTHPDTDYIAIEVHGPGIGSLLKKIAALELKNLRVIRHDAVDVLQNMIPEGALAGIHLFFPDPWPKKRHHKRRLVQLPFAALAARKLAPGGYFHAATDWPDYARQIDEVFSSSSSFTKEQPKHRPITKFEHRGIGLGHPVRDLLFVRRQK